MTIPGEIQTRIRQRAEGAGSSVAGIGQRWGVGSGSAGRRRRRPCSTLQEARGGTPELRVVRGADERTAHVVITSDIEGQ